MTKMRAIIAQRMVESVRTSPHVHTVYKVDMTRIVRLREREKAAFQQRNGFKLTYMPFIATAAIEALRRFPIVNASLVDTSIQYHQNIHLGIAVALEWGLIVPVIRQAEQRSFVDLARTLADLAVRARTKKLMPEETSGSTFTLTNSGVFGGEFGTPIINQPESAILAIGGLRKEPVVLTDAEGNDTIAIRSVQHVLPRLRPPPHRRRRLRQVHARVQASPRNLGPQTRLAIQALCLTPAAAASIAIARGNRTLFSR